MALQSNKRGIPLFASYAWTAALTKGCVVAATESNHQSVASPLRNLDSAMVTMGNRQRPSSQRPSRRRVCSAQWMVVICSLALRWRDGPGWINCRWTIILIREIIVIPDGRTKEERRKLGKAYGRWTGISPSITIRNVVWSGQSCNGGQ